MVDGTVNTSSNNTSASPPRSEFVHEVQSEESVEGEFSQFRNSFDLSNVLLVFEEGVTKDTNRLVDELRDGK